MRQLQRLKSKMNFPYHTVRRFFYKSSVVLSLLFITFFLLHCASKYEIEPVRPKHSIHSITPLCGRTGDTITIQGVNFSGIANENRVAINGTRVAVFLASPTFLKAIIPSKTNSGTVTVDINDVSSTGPAFNYLPTGVVSVINDDISLIGLTVDASKNIYLADPRNNVIRKIGPSGGTSSVAGGGPGGAGAGFVDGNGTNALFRTPTDVVLDSKGNIYVSDSDNNCIRKITPEGNVSLYAGAYDPQYGFPSPGFQDGQRLQARFSMPKGIAIDKDDNLFVCDAGNVRIRKISPDNGNTLGSVTTIAGNGQYGGRNGAAPQAMFYFLEDLVVDPVGNIFITEVSEGLAAIRKISADGIVSNVAIGPDNVYTGCNENDVTKLYSVDGIASDPNGNLYVSVYDDNIYKIITISPNGDVNTLAGGMAEGSREGVGSQVFFPYAGRLALADNILYAGTDYNIVKVEFK